MQLRNVSVEATIRLTQPNDALDIALDAFKQGYGELHPNFFKLVFFDMLNGNVSGRDDSTHSIVTGFYAKFYDTTNSEQLSTNIAKLDWYETETAYVITVTTSGNTTPASSFHMSKMELYYVANDEESTPAPQDIKVLESTVFQNTVFTSTDADSNKGILIDAADGALTGSVTFTITVNK